MTQQRGGLGRGLAALLPERGPDRPALREIELTDIRPNPRQPRRAIDDGGIAGLAASIRQVGVLQPVVVRPASTGFELIAGERRWRAARVAGLERIPAIVRATEDDAMLRDALIENLQREDLNPLEEAAAFRQLVDDFGATHEEVAERVGRSRAAVTNSLRLLALAPDVQSRIASGILSAAHGRAIAALEDLGAQARVAARAAAGGLSVRQTEELVRQSVGEGARLSERAVARRGASRSAQPPGILEAEMLLSDILSTRVAVEHRRRGGRVVVSYADVADLDRIVRRIAGDRG